MTKPPSSGDRVGNQRPVGLYPRSCRHHKRWSATFYGTTSNPDFHRHPIRCLCSWGSTTRRPVKPSPTRSREAPRKAWSLITGRPSSLRHDWDRSLLPEYRSFAPVDDATSASYESIERGRTKPFKVVQTPHKQSAIATKHSSLASGLGAFTGGRYARF